MGGPGSGNFTHSHRPPKKMVVEQCIRLCIAQIVQAGRIVPGQTMSWQETLRNARGGKVAIRYEAMADGPDQHLLRVQHPGPPARFGPPVIHDYEVAITSTMLPVGGRRWWLHCPGQNGLGTCGRKGTKLYLPPGGRQFGCRGCHGLTYLSRQEGYLRKRLGRLMEQGPDEWAWRDVTIALRMSLHMQD